MVQHVKLYHFQLDNKDNLQNNISTTVIRIITQNVKENYKAGKESKVKKVDMKHMDRSKKRKKEIIHQRERRRENSSNRTKCKNNNDRSKNCVESYHSGGGSNNKRHLVAGLSKKS